MTQHVACEILCFLKFSEVLHSCFGPRGQDKDDKLLIIELISEHLV